MGTSLVDGGPVAHQIMVAVPHTLLLAFSAFAIAVAIAVPLGIVAAVRRNTWVDMAAVVFATVGRVIPSFILGIFLMLIFSLKLGWLPMMGVGEGSSIFTHLLLPALALGLHEAGLICRMTRSAVLEVLGTDYVRTARAKGLTERIVLWRHVLRNAMITLVTVLGLRLARVVGGSVVVETLFVRIGMGRLMVDAIYARDFPVVQGCILVFGAWVLVLNLVVDLLYGVFDPRVQGV
jgi:peptide/nickel transport system permease protein